MGVRFVILDTLGFRTGLARVYSNMVVADWLCRGLQIPLSEFDSHPPFQCDTMAT